MTDNLPAVAHNPLPGLPQRDQLNAVWNLAKQLVQTEFVPASMRAQSDRQVESKTGTVLACILHGAAVGLAPTQALQHIAIVEGKPSASAELQRAWVLQRGHRIRIVEADRTHAVLWGWRADNDDEQTVTWDLHDALAAGLIDKIEDGRAIARSQRGNPLPWEKHTRNMLIARATTDLCRELFPDVGLGVSYTGEELGGEPHPDDLTFATLPTEEPEPDTQDDDTVDAEIVDDDVRPNSRALEQAVVLAGLEDELVDPHDGMTVGQWARMTDAGITNDDEGKPEQNAKMRTALLLTIQQKVGPTDEHRHQFIEWYTGEHDSIKQLDDDAMRGMLSDLDDAQFVRDIPPHVTSVDQQPEPDTDLAMRRGAIKAKLDVLAARNPAGKAAIQAQARQQGVKLGEADSSQLDWIEGLIAEANEVGLTEED